jgi:hypothetical protein
MKVLGGESGYGRAKTLGFCFSGFSYQFNTFLT